jgi:hypothetical protein
MWLTSLAAAPPRLFPAERADGSAAPSTTTDVLALDPKDVPAGRGVKVGPGPLVCPLELRARSAAALASFLEEAHPVVRESILSGSGATVETVRSRATAVFAEMRLSAMHVLTVTWSIPLPWFTLVDPQRRRLVLGAGLNDPAREVSWRVAMTDARRRVARARDLAERVIGDDGPTRTLIETDRWLAEFHPHSAVELDYGGLVQLLPDSVLETDTTAEDVHEIMAALRDGEIEKVTERFNELRERWGDLASRERHN